MAFLHDLPRRCLGFDIAKETIAVSDGRTVEVIDNRRPAIRRFLRNCRADFAVCEPTGGHEAVLLEECLRLGLPVHRADTRRLKAFIRSRGQLGKSDAIDARELAAYGLERWASLTLWIADDPCQDKLKALVRRRDDLVAMKVAEQNRSKAPGAGEMAATFRAVLAVLDRQIRSIEKAIRALMRTGPPEAQGRHRDRHDGDRPDHRRSSAGRHAGTRHHGPQAGGRPWQASRRTPTRAARRSATAACAAVDPPSAPSSSCPPCRQPAAAASSPPSTSASSPPERSQSWPSPPSCERSS
jgi:transposase